MDAVMASGGVHHALVQHFYTQLLEDMRSGHREHDAELQEEVREVLSGCFEKQAQRVAFNRWMAYLRSAFAYSRTCMARLIAYLQVSYLEGI